MKFRLLGHWREAREKLRTASEELEQSRRSAEQDRPMVELSRKIENRNTFAEIIRDALREG